MLFCNSSVSLDQNPVGGSVQEITEDTKSHYDKAFCVPCSKKYIHEVYMLSLIEKERLFTQLGCEIKKGLVSEDVDTVLRTWDISIDILHDLLENRLLELKCRG